MSYEDDVSPPPSILTATVRNMLTRSGATQLRPSSMPTARPSPALNQPSGFQGVDPAMLRIVEQAVGGPLPQTADFSYLRQGALPTIISLNDQGEVIEWGDRAPFASCPTFAAYDLYARAFSSTPAVPIQNSGDGASGELTVTVQAPAAAGPTAQGTQVLVAGFVIETSIDYNVPPGTIDLGIVGTFEDGSPWEHFNIQLQQKGQGMAQYLVTPTKTLQNRSFPCLAVLRNDFKVVLGGTGIALTAAAAPNDATNIIPTAGIQFPDASVDFVFGNIPTGMHVRVTTLGVTSRYSNVALAVFEYMLACGYDTRLF